MLLVKLRGINQGHMQSSYRGNVLYICNEECHLAKVTRKEGSWQKQKCTNTGTNLTSKVQRNSPPLVSSERHVPPNATEYATGAHTTQREIDEFQLGKFNELCWNWVGLWWTRLTFVRIRCTCRLRMWHKIIWIWTNVWHFTSHRFRSHHLDRRSR